MSDIDLVVVNYRTPKLLKDFLVSLGKNIPSYSYTLTIIDIQPDELLVDWPNYYVFDENIGYNKACNFAASITNSPYIAFFNADTRFVDDMCVDSCIRLFIDNDDVGITGPMQYNSEGKITHGGICGTHEKPFHRWWMLKNHTPAQDVIECISVSGSAYFIKREVWDLLTDCPIYKEIDPDAIGAFLETPHFYGETFCSYHAFAHDIKVVYLGTAEMIHEWHKSSPVGSQTVEKDRPAFRAACKKHEIPCD